MSDIWDLFSKSMLKKHNPETCVWVADYDSNDSPAVDGPCNCPEANKNGKHCKHEGFTCADAKTVISLKPPLKAQYEKELVNIEKAIKELKDSVDRIKEVSLKADITDEKKLQTLDIILKGHFLNQKTKNAIETIIDISLSPVIAFDVSKQTGNCACWDNKKKILKNEFNLLHNLQDDIAIKNIVVKQKYKDMQPNFNDFLGTVIDCFDMIKTVKEVAKKGISSTIIDFFEYGFSTIEFKNLIVSANHSSEQGAIKVLFFMAVYGLGESKAFLMLRHIYFEQKKIALVCQSTNSGSNVRPIGIRRIFRLPERIRRFFTGNIR